VLGLGGTGLVEGRFGAEAVGAGLVRDLQ